MTLSYVDKCFWSSSIIWSKKCGHTTNSDVVQLHVSINIAILFKYVHLKGILSTFKALEWLKYFHQAVGAQLFMIFRGYLYTDLQVLSDVGLKHCFQTFQRILNGQGTEVVYQPLKHWKYLYHDLPPNKILAKFHNSEEFLLVLLLIEFWPLG